MTPQEKQQILIAIETRLEQTRQLVAELTEATRPLGPDNAIGRISRMDYINNKAVGEAGLRTAQQRLIALQRWMSMIDTPQFGLCSQCNQPIDINRLLLMPESTRCIQCASR